MMIRRFFIILSIFILYLLPGALPAAEQTVEEFINALTPNNRKVQKEFVEDETSIGTPRGLAREKIIHGKPKVTLHLQFNFNSSELQSDAIVTLRKLGLALQNESLRGYVFRLEGHTCDLGTDTYNMTLSRQRAMAVRNYLSKNFNLNQQQFKVAWFGEGRPALPNTNEASRQKNRRVVIINTLESFDLTISSQTSAILQIKSLRDGMERIVQDGDALDENDRYAVEFKLITMRYAYLFQIDSVGNIQRLFPKSDFSQHKNPIESKRIYRVPSLVRWLQLDKNKGIEKIILLASHEPVNDPQKVCMRVAGGNYHALKARGVGGVRQEKPDPDSSSYRAESFSGYTGNQFVMARYFVHK